MNVDGPYLSEVCVEMPRRGSHRARTTCFEEQLFALNPVTIRHSSNFNLKSSMKDHMNKPCLKHIHTPFRLWYRGQAGCQRLPSRCRGENQHYNASSLSWVVAGGDASSTHHRTELFIDTGRSRRQRVKIRLISTVSLCSVHCARHSSFLQTLQVTMHVLIFRPFFCIISL